MNMVLVTKYENVKNLIMTGDFQTTSTPWHTTSQEGAWSRSWWLTPYCCVETLAMITFTTSHMEHLTRKKQTTSSPGSHRTWKAAGKFAVQELDINVPLYSGNPPPPPSHHFSVLYRIQRGPCGPQRCYPLIDLNVDDKTVRWQS